MYKLHLILKYLRKRRIAWVSLLAVTMCTALVLVVISVMGGWIDNFRQSFRGMTGDVLVSGKSIVGFPQYEEMLAEIRKLDGVEAAAPAIQSFGLINFQNSVRKAVQIYGFTPDIVGVNRFGQSLHLRNDAQSPRGGLPIVRGAEYSIDQRTEFVFYAPDQDGNWPVDLTGWDISMSLAPVGAKDTATRFPAVVVAPTGVGRRVAVEMSAGQTERLDVAVNGYTYQVLASRGDERRTLEEGKASVLKYTPFSRADAAIRGRRSALGMVVGAAVAMERDPKTGEYERPSILYEVRTRLTLLPISPYTGNVDFKERAELDYNVVDDSQTHLYQFDSTTVYVPFDSLQEALTMNRRVVKRVAPDGSEIDAIEPARCSEIQIRARSGADLNVLRDEVQKIVADVRMRAIQRTTLTGADVNAALARLDGRFPIKVETWRQANAKYLDAIESEKVLVTFLFSLVSLVAIFLILCVFYMIVKEKTRDIGIMKSVGATSNGIASIFLGYGAAIGIAGGGLGVLCGYLVVHNINFLHTQMGKWMGIQIWKAETYQFDRIPSTINSHETTIIFLVAIIASIIGAGIPAWLAARLEPVEALRSE